ncbi:MAG: DUF3592 domain-containing protein [Bacteroidia bacterium]|nr:DUF3592 domain-containing protein [Bacteroidia bacterium]
MNSFGNFKRINLGWSFAGGGLLLLLMGSYFYFSTRMFLSGAKCTDAEIVSFNEAKVSSRNTDTFRKFYAEMIFKADNGKRYKIRSDIAKNLGEEEIGQKIKVYYNDANPAEFMFNPKTSMNSHLPIIFLALILMVGGFIFHRKELKNKKQDLLKKSALCQANKNIFN